MYKRILIAIDASELSHRGLFQGLELAKATGAKVDIVTVSEPWAMGMYDAMGWSVGYEASPEYRKEREAAAEKILRPALELAAAANIKATPRHVLDRFAAEGIVQTAKDCNSDLTLPLFAGVLSPRITRPFYAVPRTSVAHIASG
ncbi:universal stress protein [Xanthomonas euvesicatoria]|uniref:universal stress protein n=1 Tax=Xanthomonas euvesicatoria TaxID=456327 RepID=UPI002FCD007B